MSTEDMIDRPRRSYARSDAQEEPEAGEPRKVKLAGIVLTSVDDAGNLVSARLGTTDQWLVYDVVLDERGRRLAEQMAGHDVVVDGTVVVDDDWRRLRVRKFRQLKSKAL